jgi:hypothetical protein
VSRKLSEQVPELLTLLYLRLNGFFATGLVLQSARKREADGDVDCLAIRFPFHDQAEREVDSDPLLLLGNTPELLICEVKSSVPCSFNKRLRTDLTTVNQLLRWCGFVPKEDVPKATTAVNALLQNEVTKKLAQAGVSYGGVRIRGLFSCPACAVDPAQDRWIIYGEQMLSYVNKCLDPRANRVRCSTQYSYELWGRSLEPVVQYFKKLPRGKDPTLAGLRAHVVQAVEPPKQEKR